VNDEARKKMEGSRAIPRPPAWAMAMVWTDEEIEIARKLRNEAIANKNEERRSYYETRLATLLEVQEHLSGRKV
jgi:hypothetical protein